MSPDLAVTEEEIDAWLAAFEAGALAKDRFGSHAGHVFTGACYVHRHGERETIALMRIRIKAFNVAVGGQNTTSAGYHETITIFWVKVLAGLLAEVPAMPRVEFAHLAVARFGPRRDLLRDYYGFDVLGSEDARQEWVEPDVKALG